MSVTTTDNPISLTLRQTLGDYEVHITGDDSESKDIIQDPNISNSAPLARNPASWPDNYRRVPAYRPINRHLSYEERPNGSNGFEQGFLTLMFTGVALNAGTAQVWARTGGRYFTKIFRYAVGGEW